MTLAEITIYALPHITVKQIANFTTNYGAWAINKTKSDPIVLERLQLFTVPLTFWLYSRTVTKDGIRHFLLNGYFNEEHMTHPPPLHSHVTASRPCARTRTPSNDAFHRENTVNFR